MNALLFVGVVIAWGLTWFAIHLQVGGTHNDIAIFWRFLVSVAMLGGWLGMTGRLRRPPRAVMPWLALMGMCLFSVNFMGIYGAESILPSGIVSIVFSTSTVWNALNLWVFFKKRPTLRTLSGGIVGVVGVALLLGSSSGVASTTRIEIISGMGLALVGTFMFSFGNMVTRRLTQDGCDLQNAVFYGMAFGTLLMGLSAVSQGHSFAFPFTAAWIGGLAYLSLIGSVAGFLAYLSLAERIGPDCAAHTTILSPVIALAVSAVFEHQHWSAVMCAGIVLVLIGNVLTFTPRRLPTPVEQA